mmetsp:Transcript_53357/g.107062  ORF Transcript_53357/g.107062 Transcript_53357/m.107062 type:complete len:214 (+) Transcript_53357:350-991(+)
MRLTCSSSVLPGNRGFRSTSSAKMHPADHMSTAQLYFFSPSRSSGGRYHKVITLLVKRSSVLLPVVVVKVGSNDLASPKSASFKVPSALSKRLEHLRSRCTNFSSWMYLSTSSSCRMMHFTSSARNWYWSSNPDKSWSTYSSTMKMSPTRSKLSSSPPLPASFSAEEAATSSSGSSRSNMRRALLDVTTWCMHTMFSWLKRFRILISRTAVRG